MKSKELWLEFLKEFGQVLDKRSSEIIGKAWTHPESNRTAFYANDVLPDMANALGLVCKREEFLNIDHVFRDSDRVPRVFIESENRADTAEAEIRKLCAASCPLRVLITVARWDLSEGVWLSPDGSQRNALLSRWEEIVLAHHRVWPNPGLLALLVGERHCNPNHQEFQHSRFRYYAHHFDTAIGKWHSDGIYQRYLAGPNQNQKGQRLDDWPC